MATIVSAIAQSPANPADGPESNVWRITANLDNSGQSTGTTATLTFTPTATIRGTRGTLSGGGQGRVPYAAPFTAIPFTATIRHQTLQITSVSFGSYTNTTNFDNLQHISGPGVNDSNAPTQSPALIRYMVTYNLPPPTFTDAYSAECFVSGSSTTCPSTITITARAGSATNTHEVDITDIPAEFTGRIRLINASTAPAVPADAIVGTQPNANFYIRPRVTMTIAKFITGSDALIRVTASEPIDNFPVDKVAFVVGANTPTATTTSRTFGTEFDFTIPLAGIPASTDVVFTITDTNTNFFSISGNSERLFNPETGGYPYTLTDTTNIDNFQRVATIPTIASIDRVGSVTLSAGGGGTNRVAWTVTFDQNVIDVDASDFEAINELGVSIATDIDVDNSSAPTYTVTATLPTQGYDDADEKIDLRIGTNNIMGAEGITSTTNTATTRRPFGVPRRISTDSDQFLLNTDDDDITLTVSRLDSDNQTPRVDGGTHQVRWRLEFSRAVRGVDVAAASSQFAITIGGSATSLDSASTDVMVTGSGRTYTATVALPQSSYPADTALNLTLASSLSGITQIDNSHTKNIVLSTATSAPLTTAGTVLTGNTNNYTFNTGALTVASITSVTGSTARTVSFHDNFQR